MIGTDIYQSTTNAFNVLNNYIQCILFSDNDDEVSDIDNNNEGELPMSHGDDIIPIDGNKTESTNEYLYIIDDNLNYDDDDEEDGDWNKYFKSDEDQSFREV